MVMLEAFKASVPWQGQSGALCIGHVAVQNRIITVRHSGEQHERKLKAPKDGHARIVYTDKISIDEPLAV